NQAAAGPVALTFSTFPVAGWRKSRFPVATQPEGPVDIVIVSNDVAGHADTTTRRVQHDNSWPTLSVTRPRDPSFSRASVHVTASCQDRYGCHLLVYTHTGFDLTKTILKGDSAIDADVPAVGDFNIEATDSVGHVTTKHIALVVEPNLALTPID